MNGWHRLWVMVVIIWLCVVASASWFLRPKAESLSHRKEFLAAVNPQNAMVRCSHEEAQEDCEKRAKLVIAMPNGYHFLLAVEEKNPEGLSAVKSYWQAVESEANRERSNMAFSAILVWLAPSLAVLLLGHGVAWVRRGFKGR